MDEKLPDRQSIRLKGWDYSSPGWYFVTICVQDMRPVFGNVVKGNMVLNDVGWMVQEMWLAVERFYPEYHLDGFVIIPNHVHGLVRIMGNPDGIRGKPDGLPLRSDARSNGEVSPHGQLRTKTGEAIISIESSKRLWMPAWYNEYVLARCDRMVVDHLNPGGMLACILSEKTLDLEITFL